MLQPGRDARRNVDQVRWNLRNRSLRHHGIGARHLSCLLLVIFFTEVHPFVRE